jgi:hypothetical protein
MFATSSTTAAGHPHPGDNHTQRFHLVDGCIIAVENTSSPVRADRVSDGFIKFGNEVGG